MARKKTKKNQQVKRRRKRLSTVVNRVLTDVAESEEITESSWRVCVERCTGHSTSWQASLVRTMDAHGDDLGPRWATLIIALLAAEWDEESREEYLRRLRSYPPSSYVACDAGHLCYLEQGKQLQGKRHYLEAVRLDPLVADPYHSLGLVYHGLGAFGRAAEHFQSAVDCAGDDEFDRQVAARSLFNLGVYRVNLARDRRGAKKFLERALEKMPDYPEAQQVLDDLRRRRSWRERIFG